MATRFAELDFRSTPRGDISLRRRHDPALGREVYEVLLGDEYLMSSAFTAAEEELARLAPGPGERADYAEARRLFLEVALADDFPEFLTLPAYERMP